MSYRSAWVSCWWLRHVTQPHCRTKARKGLSASSRQELVWLLPVSRRRANSQRRLSGSSQPSNPSSCWVLANVSANLFVKYQMTLLCLCPANSPKIIHEWLSELNSNFSCFADFLYNWLTKDSQPNIGNGIGFDASFGAPQAPVWVENYEDENTYFPAESNPTQQWKRK